MWAGDQTRRFDKLDDQLLAVLNSAVSGVPFMAYDMAGYQYDKHGEPLSEERESRVFARAAAFSVYMPCLQTHGHVRHPYELGEIGRRAYLDCVAARAARAEEMRRLNANAVKTGIAPVRPLVFEFQDDEAVWDMFDEFMYGERTLVAPVLGEADEREVYLPQGTWKDLGSGEVVVAGRGGVRVVRSAAPGGVIAFARRWATSR